MPKINDRVGNLNDRAWPNLTCVFGPIKQQPSPSLISDGSGSNCLINLKFDRVGTNLAWIFRANKIEARVDPNFGWDRT